MSCRDCGFLPELFKEWGYLETPHPRFECGHADGFCRFCNSCSAWWHRLGMEVDADAEGIKHEDCPDCLSTIEAMEE